MSNQINIVIADKNLDTKVLNGLIVKSEVNANTIEIEFPKIYDGENLENKIFVIKTINANGVYFEEILPKTIAENKIVLTWKIGSEYTSVSGDLRVAIFAEGTNYVLGTKTSKIFIENSPQFTAPISPEDVFEKYLREIRVRSESAANSAEQSLKILTDMNSKIVDDFTSTEKNKALSANKGRELNTRVENLVGQTGTSNTEIVDARNSPERNTIYPTLKARLDAVDGDMVKSKFSAPTTATAPIISLPSTAVKGKMGGTLKGNTLYQAVVNGDFANGTSGWLGVNATLSATSKILSVAGNGGSASPYVQGDANQLKTKNGDKVFCKARVRVTNANCTSIQFNHVATGDTDILVTINTPVQNQWYDIYAIASKGVDDPTSWLSVIHNYPDAVTANGKIMEIDGNVGVLAIPLSGTSYTDWSASQINNLINGYWEGLGNTKSTKVKSIGKNLLDKSKFIKNKIVDFNNGGLITTIDAYQASDFVKLESNATYFLSNNESPNTAFYDINKNFTRGVSGKNIKFTTTPDEKYIRVTCKNINVDTVQLTKGSTALLYEPYTETELFCPVELGSIPNGVADEFTFDGKHIQRTKEYALQSGDVVDVVKTGVNIDVVMLNKQLDDIKYNTLSSFVTGNTIIFPNFKNGQYTDEISAIGNIYVVNATRYGLIVAKNTYGSATDARTALAGTKIRYQLATPIETQYPASNLIAEPSGTIYVDSAVKAVKPYKTNITLDVKIKNLISVTKVDGENRVPILLSLVNVASDGMSLTILNASSGDMYELEYEIFGATLPTVEYSYPLNLNAQVQGNTEQLKNTDKILQDFLAYQNAVNAQVDLRLVLLERK